MRYPFTTVALALAASAVAPASAQVRVAVLDLTASGVDPIVAKSVSEFYATQVSALGCCTVITQAEVMQVLGFEAQKQLVGCSDEACVAEIGGALGVDKLATGTLGKLAEDYVLSLKLMDVKAAKVEGRFTDKVSSPDALLGALERGVPRIFAGVKGARGLTARARVAEAVSGRFWTWILLGGGVAAAGGGFGLGLASQSITSGDRPFMVGNVVHHTITSAEADRANQFAAGANAAYGTAVVFAALAVVAYFIEGPPGAGGDAP